MAMEIEQGKSESDFPYWKSIYRKFAPDSPFFSSGDIERQLLHKQAAIDLTEDEKKQLIDMDDHEREIFCPIVGCGARLKSLEGFEDHYNASHTASCSVCHKAYPTQRLLSIHVSEVHDSYFKAKVARGYPMYECLVETCGLKFKSYKARHQHLVDKHKFPTTFEFYKKVHLSKKQRQKQWRKQALCKEETSNGMPLDAEVDDTMEDLTSAICQLSTSDSMPSSISFGRRHNRGLAFVPRSVQREKRPDDSSSTTNR
ncbi:zinc finger protein 511-like isoform X1 [Chenopodium quinoa]|uniref:C2H2-type domain-containing protein n=1 Tax=Chenopodium quinoa TaxID=63459 RepID=A0A803MHF3_CHEQI|nr:zinc finger protein 511-like isoform X1 [Chenopodium quinoa]XP_021727486.1 zinc finger protein 511-like isoform X1 [Chenopodium quinoa]